MLFIHSCLIVHLSCFQISAIRHSARMYIRLRTFFFELVFFVLLSHRRQHQLSWEWTPPWEWTQQQRIHDWAQPREAWHQMQHEWTQQQKDLGWGRSKRVRHWLQDTLIKEATTTKVPATCSSTQIRDQALQWASKVSQSVYCHKLLSWTCINSKDLLSGGED